MLAPPPRIDLTTKVTVSWRQCMFCRGTSFKSPREFCTHLRINHCTKEGGSYVCNYGANNICKFLPLEGVCDKDYEAHVDRCHVSINSGESSHRHHTHIGPNNRKEDSSFSQSSTTGADYSSKTSLAKTGRERKAHQQRMSMRDSDSDSDTSSASRNYAEVSDLPMQAYQERARKTKWTVYHAKVNMPALLNDPRPGKRQPDFFTKTWGVGWDYLDLSPHPDIPEVTTDHFLKYLKAVAPRLGRHRRNAANPPPDTKVPIDAFPALYTRAHDKASSDLSKVPKIFITSAFNLEEEITFNTVFPWNQVEKSAGQSKRLLQEQFSHYLDIIEVQIARQVALKSEVFFHVMTSHETLQSHLADSVRAIAELRCKMRSLDNTLVQRPFTLIRLTQKKKRLTTVLKKLKLMSTIHQTQPTVQLLLAGSDYMGALDLISMSQEILSQELNGIKSFRHLSSQLNEMEQMIGSMVKQEFSTFITKDLNRPVAEDCGAVDEERLTAIYMGLLRQNRVEFIDMYRDEAYATIKSTVKLTVIEYVSATEHADVLTGAGLADQMRRLNFTSWLILMEDIFSNLLIILNRIKVICEMMGQMTKRAAGFDTDNSNDTSQRLSPNRDDQERNAFITEMMYDKIVRQMRELLRSICELANERCAKVITARSKDSFLDSLTSHEFFSLMSAVEKFTKACDQVGGRSSNTLRSCLQGQSSRFINKFHEERKAKLNLSLENERWRIAEVPRKIQAMVTNAELCEQLVITDDVDGSVGSPLDGLTVDGQKYCIVGTAVILVKMVLEYCTCVEDIPKSAPDVLTRLVELLKLFNSRSSQLVLGAGALKLGLKTISAKNLALVCRCLQLMVYYLPHIKIHFSVHLSGQKSSLLRHLDAVDQDYKLHVLSVQQKLGELANAMLDSCICQWEIRAPMPSVCFRMLTKQLTKFYEATCDVLSSADLQTLFNQANSLLKSKLRDRLRSLNITNLTGPQQGLVMADLTFFTQNILTLSKSLSFSLTLNDLIIR